MPILNSSLAFAATLGCIAWSLVGPNGAAASVLSFVPSVPSPLRASASPMAERIAYAFPAWQYGLFSLGPVLADPEGSLYGTTSAGGDVSCNYDCGLVYKLTKTRRGYVESILHDFTGSPDGEVPSGNLIADANGALYGTTINGGFVGKGCLPGCGTVYKLTPSRSGYSEAILYMFKYGKDGAYPQAGLVSDLNGALYGTTIYGGDPSCTDRCGTVFKLTPAGSSYHETIIHRFLFNHADGVWPASNLVVDAKGNLFGTTLYGGSGHCGSGCGTVFELSPTRGGYVEHVIYSFQGGGDGGYADAGLVADQAGGFYGTTMFGGLSERACDEFGCGTVFRLSRSRSSYSHAVLYDFQSGSDGQWPMAAVTIGSHGKLFGTTKYGGCPTDDECGTVFELIPSGSSYAEKVLHAFTGSPDGLWPEAELTITKGGMLYGTTNTGGNSCNCGIIFMVDPDPA